MPGSVAAPSANRSASAVCGFEGSSSRTRLAPATGTNKRTSHRWWGPVTLRGSEPYMAVAVSGRINLKPISDIVSAIHVGETGQAFVLDGAGPRAGRGRCDRGTHA